VKVNPCVICEFKPSLKLEAVPGRVGRFLLKP
jgi:hypothetical protein